MKKAILPPSDYGDHYMGDRGNTILTDELKIRHNMTTQHNTTQYKTTILIAIFALLILDHPRTLLAQTRTLLHNSEAPLEAQKIIALKGSTAPRPDHQFLPLLVFF